MRNRWEVCLVPSANSYTCVSKKSFCETVPAPVSVENTSAGMDNSFAPRSIVKFSVILSFMTTGTTNVPCSRMSGIDSACAVPNARNNVSNIDFGITRPTLLSVTAASCTFLRCFFAADICPIPGDAIPTFTLCVPNHCRQVPIAGDRSRKQYLLCSEFVKVHCCSAHAERFRDARKGATNSDRRRPLCPGSRVDPWVLHLEPCRQSDPGDPENSLRDVAAARPLGPGYFHAKHQRQSNPVLSQPRPLQPAGPRAR